MEAFPLARNPRDHLHIFISRCSSYTPLERDINNPISPRYSSQWRKFNYLFTLFTSYLLKFTKNSENRYDLSHLNCDISWGSVFQSCRKGIVLFFFYTLTNWSHLKKNSNGCKMWTESCTCKVNKTSQPWPVQLLFLLFAKISWRQVFAHKWLYLKVHTRYVKVHDIFIFCYLLFRLWLFYEHARKSFYLLKNKCICFITTFMYFFLFS